MIWFFIYNYINIDKFFNKNFFNLFNVLCKFLFNKKILILKDK